MKLKNSDNNTGFQPSLCGNAECSNEFLAGAKDGGAETSEFGGDEP